MTDGRNHNANLIFGDLFCKCVDKDVQEYNLNKPDFSIYFIFTYFYFFLLISHTHQLTIRSTGDIGIHVSTPFKQEPTTNGANLQTLIHSHHFTNPRPAQFNYSTVDIKYVDRQIVENSCIATTIHQYLPAPPPLKILPLYEDNNKKFPAHNRINF